MKDPKDDAKELSGIELSSGWRNSDDRGVPDMSIGVETSICGATEIPPLSPLLPSLPPFSATSMPRPIAGASTMVSADGGLGSSSEARLPCSADCAVPIFRLRSLYETAEGKCLFSLEYRATSCTSCQRVASWRQDWHVMSARSRSATTRPSSFQQPSPPPQHLSRNLSRAPFPSAHGQATRSRRSYAA